MSDYIGNVEVPAIVPSGTFPIVPDYGYGYIQTPQIVVHQFGSGNAKIEQRFLLGNGATRYSVRRRTLNKTQREALRDFWEGQYGPYGAFTYNLPNDNGSGTTAKTCRFENEPLSWEMVADYICSPSGLTLVEIPDDSAAPTYTLNDTLTRFPDSTLTAALLVQVQQLIPLIKIQPKESGYPAIYASDRRCTVAAQLYQARLVSWGDITQSIGNDSDQADFVFGNADRVMRDLVNDTDLMRAGIEFSLFHVGTGIKIDIWKGEIIDWQLDAGPEFKVTAADSLYELNLPYPTRRISRQCWKDYNDGQNCPFSTASTGMDVTHFPSCDSGSCDKSYDADNGCLAHGMKRYFGGILAEPQAVRVLDNSTGTWGFGRSSITSVSLVAETLYDQIVPEIYTDVLMPINAKIAAGRDEGDYYEALAVVGEGPITLWVPTGSRAYDSFGNLIGSKLDGQFNHGFPGSLGFASATGTDPAGASEYFSMDRGYGSKDTNITDPSWRLVVSGKSIWKDTFAAGTAFLVIRRADAAGLQLSTPGQHQVQAFVSQGMGGWVWTAPGSRTWTAGIVNPIWVAVNMLIRARGFRSGANLTSTQLNAAESLFDVDSAVSAATICDDSVSKLIGAGSETQFMFRGILQEEKPLSDWLKEVLMNCLGYYSFAFGKIKFGIRENSSAIEAFTVGNILFASLVLGPAKPAMDHLSANFADEEYQFANNSISVYDIDYAKRIGGASSPLFLKSNMNLSGSSTKSQAGRVISTRLREELGGTSATEWKNGRRLGFKTTVLSLNADPGMVASMTHNDMPGGSGEFRVQQWTLHPDYSIDIQGRTTTDSMYDLVAGPKPADVPASPVPSEWGLSAEPRDILISGGGNGTLNVGVYVDPTIPYTGFDLSLLIDQETNRFGATTTLAADITDADISADLASVAGVVVGQYINIGSEAIQITGPGDTGAQPSSTTVDIERGKAGTTAAAHTNGDNIYALVALPSLHWDYPLGYAESVETITSGPVGPTYPYKYLYANLPSIGPTRILSASIVMRVRGGIAPEFTKGLAVAPGTFPADNNISGALPGVRTLDGSVVYIEIPGPLAVGSDLAMPVYFPDNSNLHMAWVEVLTAPTGQSLKGKLQIDDGLGGWTDWGPEFEILDGDTMTNTFLSGAQQGNLGGRQVRVSITQVGTTNTGADLRVHLPY